jgi:hypothetical protein
MVLKVIKVSVNQDDTNLSFSGNSVTSWIDNLSFTFGNIPLPESSWNLRELTWDFISRVSEYAW